ncbi:hypothetical protein AP1H75_05710 [Apilactobacillus apinorum]
MENIIRAIRPGSAFEYHNRKIRRIIRNKVQLLMEPFQEDKHFDPCNVALDKIYCCNDMNYMLLIMQSSRLNKLEYMIECIENRDQRRIHRQMERSYGFWHP